MITLDDIRRFAAAYPEVEEVTHFGQPSFKVRGKPFAGMEKGGATAVFSVEPSEAAAAVADDPDTYEEVWRTIAAGSPAASDASATRIFVGLRVDLARVSEERVRDLVERAWRNKAPKRLVAAHDAG